MRPGWMRRLNTHLLRRDVEHARLRGHDEQVVRGNQVAAGAQAVAVEDGADLRAVRADDQRRAVPRLHERRVVLVEGALGRDPSGCGPPRPPGSASSSRAAAMRPVASSSSSALSKLAVSLWPLVAMIGSSFLTSSPRSVDCEHRLARGHPVDVAAQRVDLAVVDHVAVRVRQLPGAQRVGAEARVHQREGRRPSIRGSGRGRRARSGRRSAGPCRRWCATRGCRRRSRPCRRCPCL